MISRLDLEAGLAGLAGQEVLGKETHSAIREFGGSKELREHVRGRADSSNPRKLIIWPSPMYPSSILDDALCAPKMVRKETQHALCWTRGLLPPSSFPSRSLSSPS